MVNILPAAPLGTTDQMSPDRAAVPFEWIETWYNPRRQHSCNGGLSPIDYETANAA
jgi:transposase InsO family protein